MKTVTVCSNPECYSEWKDSNEAFCLSCGGAEPRVIPAPPVSDGSLRIIFMDGEEMNISFALTEFWRIANNSGEFIYVRWFDGDASYFPLKNIRLLKVCHNSENYQKALKEWQMEVGLQDLITREEASDGS